MGELIVIMGVLGALFAETIGDKKIRQLSVMGRSGPTGEEFPVLEKKYDDKRRLMSRQSELILVLGLFVSLSGIFKTNQLSNEQIAALTVLAREAEDNASQAQLALETYKTPRTLSKKQREAIRGYLAKLRKDVAPTTNEIDVWICGADTETAGIGGVLISLLKQDGWNVRAIVPLRITANGIMVGTRADSDEATQMTASFFAPIFRSQGLDAVDMVQFRVNEKGPFFIEDAADTRNTTAPIRIIIGAKPTNPPDPATTKPDFFLR